AAAGARAGDLRGVAGGARGRGDRRGGPLLRSGRHVAAGDAGVCTFERAARTCGGAGGRVRVPDGGSAGAVPGDGCGAGGGGALGAGRRRRHRDPGERVPVPGCGDAGGVLDECGGGRGVAAVLHGGGARGGGSERGGDGEAELRTGADGAGGRGDVRRGVLRLHAAGSGSDGPAAAGAARVCGGSAGARRLRRCGRAARRRRLRRCRRKSLLHAPPFAAARCVRRAGLGHGVHAQPREPRGDADLVQAEPDGPEREREHGVLDVAGGGAPGGAEPAARGVPAGAGGRCGDRGVRSGRLPVRRGRDPVGGRTLPGLRPGGERDASRAWRRRGGAQAPGRRAGRRGHDRGGDQRVGGQQRRRREGGLHGAERAGPGAGDRLGVEVGRGVGGDDHVRGDARDGDGAGRPHRGGGAEPGVRVVHGTAAVLRDRVGEAEHRTFGCSGGDCRIDQDGGGAQARRAAAERELPGSEPADRLCGERVLREHGAAEVGVGGAAASRGELVRDGGHERARDRGRSAGGIGREGPPGGGSAGGVGEDGDGAGAGERGTGKPPGGARGGVAVGRGVHAEGGTHGARGAASGGVRERGGSNRGIAARRGGGGGGGEDGVDVPGPRNGTGGDGACAVCERAGVPGAAGGVRGSAEGRAGRGPDVGAVSGGGGPGGSGGATQPDGVEPTGTVRGVVQPGDAVGIVRTPPGGGGGSQPRGIRGGVRGGRAAGGRGAEVGGAAGTAAGAAGTGRDGVGEPERGRGAGVAGTDGGGTGGGERPAAVRGGGRGSGGG